MTGSIETRIARLEDREAIRALCSAYSLAVDDHDFATLGDLFAPDARYGWIDAPPQAIGRDAIRALLTERIGPAGPSFHVNHDMIVEWDEAEPDRPRGVVFCHAEVSPGARHMVGAIRYRDRYCRLDGRWLFAERFLSFLYFVPVADYPGILTRPGRLRTGAAPQPAHWPPELV